MTQSTPAPGDPGFYCCDHSRQVGEQLFGTMPRADVWLLLEYTAPWAAKALADNALPPAVTAWLNQTVDGYALRPLLIRQSSAGQRPVRDTLACFVAVVDETQPRLYEFRLRSYADLLDIDLPALLVDPERFARARRAEPLYLVCTNGRRDRACARYGMAVYRALHAAVGTRAWQATHLGGHRFAATALVLPQGAGYGYLDVTDVPALVAAVAEGQILPEKLRGYTGYAKPVQAAAYFLRVARGLLAQEALRLYAAAQPDPATWTVQFMTGLAGDLLTVTLAVEAAGAAVYMRSTDAAPEPVPQYRLLDITAARE